MCICVCMFGVPLVVVVGNRVSQKKLIIVAVGRAVEINLFVKQLVKT